MASQTLQNIAAKKQHPGIWYAKKLQVLNFLLYYETGGIQLQQINWSSQLHSLCNFYNKTATYLMDDQNVASS